MNAVSIIGVVSVFGLVFLWLLALCVEKGVHPLGRVRKGFRRLPGWEKTLILIFLSVWIAFAGTKDGTNQMENAELKMENGLRADSILRSPFYTLHSDVQGLPTVITSDDVAQLWRIDATVDENAFAAPTANAVTNAAWSDYGGMSDTFRLLPEGWRFPFGTKTATGLAVFENGEFRPNVKTHFSIVYETNSGKQKLFFPDYIVSVKGEIWIVEVKGGFNTLGESENIDIYAPKKAESLKAYCVKHKLRGAFVCKDKSEDELFAFEDGFSEDIDDPGWKPIDEVLCGKRIGGAARLKSVLRKDGDDV